MMSFFQKTEQKLFVVFLLVGGCLGLFLHLWRLSQVPVSLYYDEMDYVVTGEAVARFGTDLSGQWKPTQLLPLHTMNYTAELPAVFQAFFQKVFGYGVHTARYPASMRDFDVFNLSDQEFCQK